MNCKTGFGVRNVGWKEAPEHPEKSQPLGGLMGLYCATWWQTRFDKNHSSLANVWEVSQSAPRCTARVFLTFFYFDIPLNKQGFARQISEFFSRIVLRTSSCERGYLKGLSVDLRLGRRP